MPEEIWTIILEFWGVLGEMAPYLLFGFLVAGVLSVVISPEVVERHLGGAGLWPVFKATVFGIPLPLCSCGVIPVAASLRRHGASRGATTAFLLSTPQTGIDSIFVTFSLLGPVFAIFRPLAALVSGLLGGSFVSLAVPKADVDGSAALKCTDECCGGAGGRGKLLRSLRYGFLTLPRDIGRALLVGLLIAGVISALIPKNYFADVLGHNIWAMLVMMLLGIPVYVCATASVPVAAALIIAGISPGAGLVFLMTGPATNAATIATIWKTMGRQTAIVYLLTVAVTALASGLALDYVFKVSGISPTLPEGMWMLPGYVKTAAALVLLAVLGIAFFRPSLGHVHPSEAEDDEGETILLAIKGMTCSHCAQSVQRALGECPGVESAAVDLKAGTARVGGHVADVGVLCRAVEELGYTATAGQENPGND